MFGRPPSELELGFGVRRLEPALASRKLDMLGSSAILVHAIDLVHAEARTPGHR
jgi:hypothetical protein